MSTLRISDVVVLRGTEARPYLSGGVQRHSYSAEVLDGDYNKVTLNLSEAQHDELCVLAEGTKLSITADVTADVRMLGSRPEPRLRTTLLTWRMANDGGPKPPAPAAPAPAAAKS